MRRRFMSIAIVGMLALMTTAGASASALFDPVTDHGFVSRGDVIHYLGKAGLVAEGAAALHSHHGDWTLTCRWQDGTQLQATNHNDWFTFQMASPRFAPGNGNITGYLLNGRPFDGAFPPHPTDVEACYAQADGVNHGALVGTPTVVSRSNEDILIFGWFEQLPGGGQTFHSARIPFVSADIPFTTP